MGNVTKVVCKSLWMGLKYFWIWWYNEECDEGYFFEVDIQYPENLYNIHNNLPFLTEGMKNGKVEKLAANLNKETEYVIYIRNLKQALNHELALKKGHKVIKFKSWLKLYIDKNTEVRKAAKNDFFKLMNNLVFGKTMENVQRHRDIKPVTTANRRKYLALESSYHTTKSFTENLLAKKIIKKQLKNSWIILSSWDCQY